MEKDKFVLEMHNISKKFKNLLANDNITFKVRSGTVHALIGENGAGKSTLMNILTNIQNPDSGQIYLRGEQVNFKNPLDAVRHGIGMVYQEFMVFPEMTVLDNIIMGFEQKKGIFIDYKESRRRVEEICKKYKFNIPIDAKVDELPVAALQQVEIIKVLYRNADIIILDEPTSVLTPQGVESLFHAIRFLVAQGKTIILITHKLKEVLEIADDITVLKNGRVTGTLLSKDTNELELARLMVGREVILQVEKPEYNIGEIILKVENLSVKDSSRVERVKNVSFKVQAGEIVGISGVAGSGQTELVEALVGLSNGNIEGQILFNGENIIDQTVAKRRKLGIGYIAQDRSAVGTNKEGTIWENAIMGYHRAKGFRTKHLLDYEDINSFTNKIIKDYAVKIQGVEDKVKTLSGGNIQKLLVGREFLQGQKLLIIEDPTRGIDIGSVEFIWNRIIQMAKEGVAVLLISHELNEVMQLSDRILVMYNGSMIEHKDSRSLTEEQIGLMMLGGEIHEA
ncbi:ABC transporter ATP-binding protein [Tissierella sp. MB52-C2]|uniref:ABC transporter ATP-binding protein n=1 Tax=Tissierella sp. MB52-C2 TaxID=3070999 RepID=UPI00280B85F9|nr:ABC transporter ATP-binding protein [Tissierella sp. MB52-C2]WMM24439.1 ABC transporter ATP-binding protein [Tissierella sp. MB52-C2]